MKDESSSYDIRLMNFLQEKAADVGMGLPGEVESLFKTGVIDSFGLLEFVAFIEEDLEIEIPDEDLLAGNFETIGKIRAYIRKRVER